MSESCFYSGTAVQFAWDSTSLGYIKTCPRFYEYAMVRGLRPRGDDESVHLVFGSIYHAALENYDHGRARGLDHHSALRGALRYTLESTWNNGPITWDHTQKTRETLIRSVVWYLEEFGQDDQAKTVILSNGKPAVELSFKMEIDGIVFCGHLDRLVEFGNAIYVMDRKTTTTTVASYYFDRYKPDNQMSLYTVASKIVFGTPVQGVIIDAAQIAVGFTRFARGMTYRTPDESEEWLNEARVWIDLAHQFAERGHFPMNDKACHSYGGCTYRKVCGSAPAIREALLQADFEHRPWNPLTPR